MSTNIVPVADIERMARAVAQSNLFGVKTPEQAMALMLVAQAEGMHPAIAARDFHVIDGRPALKADAMLARFQQAGGKVRWTAYTNERVAGVFSHPAGGEVEIDWTITQARQAGIAGKKVWTQYPRQMLRARVISEGVRTVFPGVAVGVYTVEEVQDDGLGAGPGSPPAAPRDVVLPSQHVSSPEAPDSLLGAAVSAAESGIETYQQFWSGLSKSDRTLIGAARHESYKQLAMSASDVTDVAPAE